MSDNAALNNSTFDVKRNAIIEMDKKGRYIPFCTKMVFLKYYTPSAGNQLHFWGQPDRIAYIKAINSILKNYLPVEISIELALLAWSTLNTSPAFNRCSPVRRILLTARLCP